MLKNLKNTLSPNFPLTFLKTHATTNILPAPRLRRPEGAKNLEKRSV